MMMLVVEKKAKFEGSAGNPRGKGNSSLITCDERTTSIENIEGQQCAQL